MTKKPKRNFSAKEAKKPAKNKNNKAERYQESPGYGSIPLIKYITIYNGKEYIGWRYDPDYQPEAIPAGAIRGDIREQVFCSMCHIPKYFYVDEEKKCIQCGETFIFSATEQKFWYETLKFNFHSEAVRCPKCRKTKRSEKLLNSQLQKANKLAEEKPADPMAQLALTEAIISFYERFKKGNLAQAVAAARKALKLSPQLFQALYFEAVCHELAERGAKATELYTTFAALTADLPLYRTLRKKAVEKIETY